MNRDGMLSVSDIVNYTYCPRIIYFEYIMHEKQKQTAKTKKAKERHIEFSNRTKRTKTVKESAIKLPRRLNVPLVSKKLNLQTVIDCLFINGNEAYPMDFKESFTPHSIYRGQKFQLAAQAMLLKEKGFTVPFGYLKFLKDNNIVKVFIKEHHFTTVTENLERIKEIIRKEFIPKPTQYTKRCVDCCFLNICRRV